MKLQQTVRFGCDKCGIFFDVTYEPAPLPQTHTRPEEAKAAFCPFCGKGNPDTEDDREIALSGVRPKL